jgi:O-antigen/teichoic acid export membrane protein
MAHLVGEGDMERFQVISWRLVQLVIALLALAVGSVVVVNEAFMKFWLGPKPYGGIPLTVALCVAVALFSCCNLLGVVLFSLGIIKAPAFVRFGQSVLQLLLVFLLIHHAKLLAIPIALAVAAAVGLTNFFIPQYSFAVHHSDLLARDQWKWFWLPIIGSMGLATGIAVAFRPQTIPAAVIAAVFYWITDAVFLFVVSKDLRAEARQAYSLIFATTSPIAVQ